MNLYGRILVGLLSIATALIIEIGRDQIRERRRKKIKQEYIDEMERDYQRYMESLN